MCWKTAVYCLDERPEKHPESERSLIPAFRLSRRASHGYGTGTAQSFESVAGQGTRPKLVNICSEAP